MSAYTARVSAWVNWLRRPREVIEQGKAFFAEYPIRSLSDLEQAMKDSGVEIAHLDIDPTTDGAAVWAGSTRYILIKPYLNNLRREFTLAHEAGHVRFHLNGPRPTGVEIETGGIEDIEADCFLLMYLGFTIQGNLMAQMVQLSHYVRVNPNMFRRMPRVLMYLSWFKTRLFIADILDRLFLTPRLQRGT